MDQYDKQLEHEIPEFEHEDHKQRGSFDISSTVSAVSVHGMKQILGIILVAVVVIGGWEILIRLFNVPAFVFPTPSAIAVALVQSFPTVYPHFLITLGELAAGYAIGVTIGLLLAVAGQDRGSPNTLHGFR